MKEAAVEIRASQTNPQVVLEETYESQLPIELVGEFTEACEIVLGVLVVVGIIAQKPNSGTYAVNDKSEPRGHTVDIEQAVEQLIEWNGPVLPLPRMSGIIVIHFVTTSLSSTVSFSIATQRG